MPSSQRLSGSTDVQIPLQPPAYEDTEDNYASGIGSERPMEQFEIEEEDPMGPRKQPVLIKRAAYFTRKLACRVRTNVVDPLLLLVDPLREGYSYLSSRYEQSLLRLGHPLVVKRLFYVLFITGVMYFAMQGQANDGVSGASGGAFSSGKFYDVEKLAASIRGFISEKSLNENIEYLSSVSNAPGTLGDLATARYVQKFFSNSGIHLVELHEVNSFLNYPKEGNYLKLADGSFEAKLSEGDSDLIFHRAYNPNSPGTEGEITAPLVYTNYGTLEDITKVVDAGVTLRGAILIMRYGGNLPESNKVYAATNLGARGVIFISPKMEWAGKEHDDVIQRINVALTRFSPGDVLSPGWSSFNRDASKMSWTSSKSAPQIPTLPISWADGVKILSKLGESGIKLEDNRFSGDGSTKAQMRVEFEGRPFQPIWDVVAHIQGREQPDKSIIFGASRDSICGGASGGATNTAVLLELVRVFTTLQRRYDWTPSRSIHFVSFDASSYNLGGSAEWVEEKIRALEDAGYAYIDVSDIALGDHFDVKANPFLLNVIKEELGKVPLPESLAKGSLKTFLDLYKFQHGNSDKISNNMLATKDYLPFINLVNMPSVSVSLTGKTVPEQSCLDTFKNLEVESESSFKSHKAMVELLARIGLRLAEEPMMPLDLLNWASELKSYEEDLDRYVREKASEFKLAKPHSLNRDKIKGAIKQMCDAAEPMDSFIRQWYAYIKSTSSLEPTMLATSRRELNDNLASIGLNFVGHSTHSMRNGYRNALMGVPFDAPLYDDKYQWNTFPTVRDHIASGKFDAAQTEIDYVADLISQAALMVAHFEKV